MAFSFVRKLMKKKSSKREKVGDRINTDQKTNEQSNQIEEEAEEVHSSSASKLHQQIENDNGILSQHAVHVVSNKAITNRIQEITLPIGKILLEQIPEKSNVLFSPISLYRSLFHVYLATDGDTREEIAKILALSPKADEQKANKILDEMIKAIESTTEAAQCNRTKKKLEKTVVKLCNAIFAPKEVSVLASYTNSIRNSHGSEIISVNFQNKAEKATDIINEFVSKNTKRKIPKLFSKSLETDTNLVAASCVHFEARWQEKFDSHSTKDEYFTTADGDVLVKMMTYDEPKPLLYARAAHLHLEACALHYAGYDLSMIVILPELHHTLHDLLASLNDHQFRQIMKQMSPTEVDLKLPRFKLRSLLDMREILEQLGMTSAFVEYAKFDNLACGSQLRLSKVPHVVQIDIREEGCGVVEDSVTERKNEDERCDTPPLPAAVNLRVDREFLLAVYHHNCETTLFLGIVRNPNEVSYVETMNDDHALRKLSASQELLARAFNETEKPSLGWKKSFRQTFGRTRKGRDHPHKEVGNKNQILEKDVAKVCVEFAASMAKQLDERASRKGNVFFSPISVFSALAAVLLGSQDETHKEICQAMRLPKGKGEQKLHEALSEVVKKMEETTMTLVPIGKDTKPLKGVISLSLGMFLRSDCDLLASYQSKAESLYRNETFNVDFDRAPDDAADTINDFVSKKTLSRVQQIRRDGTIERDNIRSILTSCAYFSANWNNKFRHNLTKEEHFNVEGFDYTAVRMMSFNKAKFLPYLDLPSMKSEAVGLPYKGSDVSMFVVMPKPDHTLEQLICCLSGDTLLHIANHARLAYVDVKLPRMKLKCAQSLRETLQELGIRNAFVDTAHLKDMTAETPFHISDIYHAAEIEIDENGTEATPVPRKLIKSPGNKPPLPSPIQFHVNRAFYFFLYHHNTEAVLFFAVVRDPNTM